jgi:hypothetical protein
VSRPLPIFEIFQTLSLKLPPLPASSGLFKTGLKT